MLHKFLRLNSFVEILTTEARLKRDQKRDQAKSKALKFYF